MILSPVASRDDANGSRPLGPSLGARALAAEAATAAAGWCATPRARARLERPSCGRRWVVAGLGSRDDEYLQRKKVSVWCSGVCPFCFSINAGTIQMFR